jgi:hypothetical protein
MKYLLPLLSLLVLLPISAIALGPHVSKVPNPHDTKIRWNRCHACHSGDTAGSKAPTPAGGRTK